MSNIYGDNIFKSNFLSESALIESAIANGLYNINEAKYSFLPKFQAPELKKYNSIAKEAENLLNAEGEPSKAMVEKGFKLVFRFLDVLWNIGSIITLPYCLTIVGIPLHLLQRLYVWAAQCGCEYFAKAESNKICAKLKELEEKTDSKQLKEKYKKMREDVANSAKELEDRE